MIKPLKVPDTKSIINLVATVCRRFIPRIKNVGASDKAKSWYLFAVKKLTPIAFKAGFYPLNVDGINSGPLPPWA